MNVLEVLSLAVQASKAASEAYTKAEVAAAAVNESSARLAGAQHALTATKQQQDEAVEAVRISFNRLAQQVKATSIAGAQAVSQSRVLVEEREAVIKAAETFLTTASANSIAEKERVDRAVLMAEHAARIRDAVITASEVTDASASFAKNKEADFANSKVAEARAAAIRAANDASVHAQACAQVAQGVYQIEYDAKNTVDAAYQAKVNVDLAHSLAQDAQKAIVKAVEAMNALGG